MATSEPRGGPRRAPGPAPGSPDLVLRRARVWPRPNHAVSGRQDVLLRAGRIAGVGRIEAPGVTEIDLGGRVVTAGFWNCHVHLTEPVWASRGPGAVEAVQDALDDMLLSRGFVGAVDLGSRPRVTAALMRRIRDGTVRGPALMTAGAGIRPFRGTPFYLRSQIPWFLRWALPMPVTPAGARLVVRLQEHAGASVIKLFTGSNVTPQSVRPMRRAIARAATAAAHARGLRVFTHPADREGTTVGIEAGVDVLAHVPDRTAGTAPLLGEAARRGIRLVPTLHMFASTVSADESYVGPLRDALRGFRDAGGAVLFGTDVGYLADRDTRPEFEAMAAAGMSTSDILASLTTEPAQLFADEQAGAIVPGHRADLTVLETTSDQPVPPDLADIFAVLREGRLIWRRQTG